MSALLRKLVPALAIASALASVSPAGAKTITDPTGPQPTPVMTVLVLVVGVESAVMGLL